MSIPVNGAVGEQVRKLCCTKSVASSEATRIDIKLDPSLKAIKEQLVLINNKFRCQLSYSEYALCSVAHNIHAVFPFQKY